MPVEMSGATVAGDLSLDGLHLRAPVALGGVTVEGVLRLRATTGLRNLQFHGPRASVASVGVADCDEPEGDLILSELDVAGEVVVERCRLRSLSLLHSAAHAIRTMDTRVLNLQVLAGAFAELHLAGVDVERGMTLDSLYTHLIELDDGRVGSWASVSTCGTVLAERWTFDGPVRFLWQKRETLALYLETGGVATEHVEAVPLEARASLSLSSVRMQSAAELLWGGGGVSLASTVFTDASSLDAAPDASAPPHLVQVSETDAEDLRIRRVDVSRCHLSEAASLGLIELDHIRQGFGSVGFTRRKYIADEGARTWPWNRPDDFALRARRLASTYRDLRRGSESAKDFLAANDLHYGERLWQRKAMEPPVAFRPKWIWLWLYGIVGYGVRPWRPFALLVALIVASALAFDAADGLDRQRAVDGAPSDTRAQLCAAGPADRPDRRQTVMCEADFGDAVEFTVRATTGVVRPVTGFDTHRMGVAIEIASRLLAALLFGVFVLAIRNRVRR
jgi:hypothetical protein